MMNKKYDIKATAQFKKDYKLAKKRGLDLKHLAKVINTLAEGNILPVKHENQALTKWNDFCECVAMPNRLLVYQKTDTTLVLDLFRTGTHSDIFGNE